MKKLTGILASVIVISALVGCSNDDKTNKEEVSHEQTNNDAQVAMDNVEELMTKVKEQLAADLKASGIEEDVLVDGVLNGYTEIDLLSEDETASSLLEKLNIKKEDLEEGRVLLPLMNVKSDQFIFLKSKDADTVATLQQSLQLAKEDQLATWATYLPDQLEKVKNNIIKTKGNYLMYVTYETPEVIADIFEGK